MQFNQNRDFEEIKKSLKEMREIASWNNTGRSLKVFPPPNGDSFIASANKIYTILNSKSPLAQPANHELGKISMLYSHIKSNLAKNNDDACRSLSEEMTHYMNHFIDKIEKWLEQNSLYL